MKTAIEQLTAAAQRVRDESGMDYGLTSATIDVTITSDGTKVTFSTWRGGRFHHALTLDEAVQKAISFNPKTEALEKAAKLRKEADELEASAAEVKS